MSLNDAIRANHPEYSALRTNLRARARDYAEMAIPARANNTRRQINRAFDAGVSATIELLRDRAPVNGLSADEWETIYALRAGAAKVILDSGEIGRDSDVVGAVRAANETPTAEAGVRGGSAPSEPEIDSEIARDCDGRELYLEARVVWRGEALWGPGNVKFLSKNGKRAKVEFDNLPGDLRQINPAELRMLDGIS